MTNTHRAIFIVCVFIMFSTVAYAQCTSFNSCSTTLTTSASPNPTDRNAGVNIYAYYYATDTGGTQCNIPYATVSSDFDGTMTWNTFLERYEVFASTSVLPLGTKSYTVTASKGNWISQSTTGSFEVKECISNFVCPEGKYCDKSTGTCKLFSPSCPAESSVLQVSVSGSAVAPCTANPTTTWIDCSATATISCSSCNSASIRYKIFSANPGTCPTKYCDYGTSATVTDYGWVCGYGEDNTGRIGVSSPIEFKVNRTFTFNITAKTYDEKGYVMKNEPVNVYLCSNDVVFCNSDVQYITKGSAVSNSQGWFTVVMSAVLDKGIDYRIGIVTSKGYAESVVRI